MFANRLAASLAIAIFLIGYPLGLRAEELMAGLGPAIHEKETRGGLTLSEPAPFYERTKQEFRWVRIPCSFFEKFPVSREFGRPPRNAPRGKEIIEAARMRISTPR